MGAKISKSDQTCVFSGGFANIRTCKNILFSLDFEEKRKTGRTRLPNAGLS